MFLLWVGYYWAVTIDKPWLKYYSRNVIESQLPECSAYEIIYKNNQDNLKRVAIEYYGNKITYEQLFIKINDVAAALTKLGIQHGDIVTVCMLNSLETVLLFYALNKVGAVANMISGLDSETDILAHIENVNSNILFTLDIFIEKLLPILNKSKVTQVIVSNLTQSMSSLTRFAARNLKGMKPKSLPSDKRFILWETFLSQGSKGQLIKNDCNAPAMICYTGGTTGGSKGVVLSNKNIIAVAQQYLWRGPEVSRDSKWAQVIPLFIAYGITCSLQIPLMAGMTVFMRIVGSETLGQLFKYSPQYITYGPAAWEELADENKNLNLSFLMEGISGGDRLPKPVEKKINDYLLSHDSKFPIYNGYGMSEVGAAVSVNFSGAHRLGSVGIPFVKNIISAFDVETGKELTYETEGEICIHSPSIMLEYINNYEETSNVIRKHDDGLLWVHSGDLGYIDKDGFVYISGRLKRYILSKYNGLYKKVFSLDIEKVLLKHPAVNNCAVVPLDDTEREQVPCAFIILQKDINNTKQAEKKLNEYCKNNLDDIYRPVKYYFLEKFPFTKIGKVDYRALEKEANLKNKEK